MADGVVAAGGEQHEAVEHLVVESGGGAQRGVAALDGAGEARPEAGVDGRVTFEVAERERHMTSLVVAGEMGDASCERVGRVTLEEAEQGDEGPLSHHGQQERRRGEVRFVQQALQGDPSADARQRERLTRRSGATAEDLDVAGLVGDRHGEHLLDLAEVRVDLAEEPGRHHERRFLVLDEERHDLHDGTLDRRRVATGVVQSIAALGSHWPASAWA